MSQVSDTASALPATIVDERVFGVIETFKSRVIEHLATNAKIKAYAVQDDYAKRETATLELEGGYVEIQITATYRR